MNALANEVDVLGFALVIQVLEFNGPFEKQLVGGFELLLRYLALIECPDADDKLAVVSIILIWKYPIEDVVASGPKGSWKRNLRWDDRLRGKPQAPTTKYVCRWDQ